MEVKSFFNILLLGISLATIFITLASFLIFKFKYNIKARRKESLYRLDGSFFKRYAPHLEQKNRGVDLEYEKKEDSFFHSKRAVVIIFAFVTSAIVIVLSSENYFTYRRDLEEKISKAQTFRDLIARGLLKQYDFDPKFKGVSTSVGISIAAKAQRDNLIKLLSKNKLFYLKLQTTRPHKEIASKAELAWKDFAKRHNLTLHPVTDTKFKNKGIYILPQLKSLSSKNRIAIKKAIDENKPMLITGPLGILNGHGDKSDDSILESMINLKVREAAHLELDYPTIVRGKGNIPAGLRLGWYPIDHSSNYVSGANSFLAIRSNHTLVPDLSGIEQNGLLPVRSLAQNGHLIWSELDPALKGSLVDNEIFYADLHVLYQLAMLADIPLITPARWMASKTTPIASVLTLDQFPEVVSDFDDILARLSLRPTVIAVDRLLENGSGTIEDFRSAVEWISSFLPDSSDLSAIDKMFSSIQNLRLMVEESSQKPFTGWATGNTTSGGKLINAAIQNRLSYVYGNFDTISLAPQVMDDGQIINIPMVHPEKPFSSNRELQSIDQIVEHVMRAISLTDRLGGMYILSLQNEILNQPVDLEILNKLVAILKRNDHYKFISLREMAQWEAMRSRLVTTVTPEGKGWKVVITNKGQRMSEKFELISDNEFSTILCQKMDQDQAVQEHLIVEEIEAGESWSGYCQFSQ